MPIPAIRPTTTTRVRQFLRENNIKLEPWSTLDETYARFYTLLQNRQSDMAFWPSLSKLLKDIRNDAASLAELPAPDAELLSKSRIDGLVYQLQSALSEQRETSAPGAVTRFLNSLPGPVLGVFMLLGAISMGCDHTDGNGVSSDADADSDGDTDADSDGDTDTDSDGDTDTDSDGNGDGDSDTDSDIDSETGSASDTASDSGSDSETSWVDQCALDNDSVLETTIANANIHETSKPALCECIASLESDWNSGLTELFETASEDELANTLANLMRCCQFHEGVLLNPYTEETAEKLRSSVLCEPVVVYKGVAFYDDDPPEAGAPVFGVTGGGKNDDSEKC